MESRPGKTIGKIRGELADARRKIIEMDPARALDRILAQRTPAALVHSFPEEDFYLLVQEIGPADSLELLALASGGQLQHLLDREIWTADRLDLPSVTGWLDLLLRADPRRGARWLMEEQWDLLAWYLMKTTRTAVREHDQEASDFGPEWFTVDGTWFVRFQPPPPADDEAPPEASGPGREEILTVLLQRLSAHDPVGFQELLLASTGVLPAEQEEAAYRLRSVRMAEKGFLPFEEAVGVYQPLDPAALSLQGTKFAPGHAAAGAPHRFGFYPQTQMDAGSLLTAGLRLLGTGKRGLAVQSEFAALCNRVIVADRSRVRERKQLEPVVAKVAGYLTIGLERLTRDTPAREAAQHAAALMERFTLERVFRVGFGLALALKWRAERWQPGSWAAATGLPLSFWGEAWLGVLGGLLVRRPLHYDNYRSGVLYREFTSLKEIREAGRTLDRVIATDDLLRSLDPALPPEQSPLPLTWKNLLLTLWARHELARPPGAAPLSAKDFGPFFTRLFDRAKDPARVPAGRKAAFLSWLSAAAGRTEAQISAALGPVLDRLFDELESECAPVAPADLDARYLRYFRLQPAAGETD